jgi:hypothetical protein
VTRGSGLSGAAWFSVRRRCWLKCMTYSASTRSRWRRWRISIRSSISWRTVSIHRSAIAFARGRSHRCAQDADALTGEHGVKDAGELAVAVADQEKAPG